jgi:hypothetical protein
MISLGATRTADLVVVAVLAQELRRSAASQDSLGEDQCSRMRSRQKSYSTGFLEEVALVAGLVVVPLACVRTMRPKLPACADLSLEGGFGGPQFVFNMGGGPGFTVHRMGGGMPRRRPRTAEEQQQQGGLSGLAQLLPLLLLFLLPLLSNLFTASTAGPSFRFDQPQPPMTMHRVTPRYKLDYFVNPKDVDGWKSSKLNDLDKKAEAEYIQILQYNCADETQRKRNEMQDATGFFFTDEARLKRAKERKMPACERLGELRIARRY